ncbi:MAG: replication initiation protein [Bacteroidales bacterium]|nr:replication initiation protein [Bacteroidales bacterium]
MSNSKNEQAFDNSIVQKSRPLLSLSKSELSLAEFKILDVYLSRVNMKNPDDCTVRLERGELEKLLGVSRLRKEDLEKRLRNLFQVVKIEDNNERQGFRLTSLFDESYADLEEKGWFVTLTCSHSAKKYIFNIENIGYLKYYTTMATSFTSRYAYVLFLYLANNAYRHTWKISLEELKNNIKCTASRYEQFKHFKAEILEKSKKEIEEITDLRFSYSSLRVNRKVAYIEFSIIKISPVLQKIETQNINDDISNQIDYMDDADYDNDYLDSLRNVPCRNEVFSEEVEYGNDLLDLLGNAACDNEFSYDELLVIKNLVLKTKYANDHLAMCDYLIDKMNFMNLYQVKDRFKYLCKMIKSDIESGDY